MIDTGASISAIDDAFARSFNFPQTGSTYVAGVVGARQVPVYGVEVRIPDPVWLRWDPFQLAGTDLGAPDFQMLIGRDILSSLGLSYQGKQGVFSISV